MAILDLANAICLTYRPWIEMLMMLLQCLLKQLQQACSTERQTRDGASVAALPSRYYCYRPFHSYGQIYSQPHPTLHYVLSIAPYSPSCLESSLTTSPKSRLLSVIYKKRQ